MFHRYGDSLLRVCGSQLPFWQLSLTQHSVNYCIPNRHCSLTCGKMARALAQSSNLCLPSDPLLAQRLLRQPTCVSNFHRSIVKSVTATRASQDHSRTFHFKCSDSRHTHESYHHLPTILSHFFPALDIIASRIESVATPLSFPSFDRSRYWANNFPYTVRE